MYEERVQWMEYKGLRYLSLDYSNVDIADMPIIFEHVKREVKQGPPTKSTIYLTNVENVHFSLNMVSMFNKLASETKPWDKGGAIMGVKGLVKVMYDAFAKVNPMPMKTFEKREDALEWLLTIK